MNLGRTTFLKLKTQENVKKNKQNKENHVVNRLE